MPATVQQQPKPATRLRSTIETANIVVAHFYSFIMSFNVRAQLLIALVRLSFAFIGHYICLHYFTGIKIFRNRINMTEKTSNK